MPIYELINPSDPYTFEAANVTIAGATTCLLGPQFGAKNVADEDECTPAMFGWKEWLEEHGIDSGWLDAHKDEIADALDSFLIGGADTRADTLSMLAELPEEKREAWRAKRQDRRRSSISQIGEVAYALAKRLRQDGAE